jgi:hypothetical protein
LVYYQAPKLNSKQLSQLKFPAPIFLC